MKHNDTNMQPTDVLMNEIYLERKMASAVVDKIMSLDPITIEWIKLLMKQWYDEVLFKTKTRICKDIFQALLNNGIIDESAEVAGSCSIMRIEGHTVWFNDIAKLLEKT